MPDLCPCCGQPKPPLVQLAPMEQRIYDFVVKHPDCTNEQIVSHLYHDHPDGGPLYAENSVSVHMVRIRRKLREHGLTMGANHKGVGATFRLRTLKD